MHKLADVEAHRLRQMPLFSLVRRLLAQKSYVRGFPLNRLGWPILKYAWIDRRWRAARKA
jgi:hypothetical protein